jgi:Flp pilus assembly protein CpaB
MPTKPMSNASGTDDTKRSFTTRRTLPSSRAVVGALLMTIAAVGAFSIATDADRGPTTEYLVLVDDIEPGDRVEPDDIAFAPMTLASDVAENSLTATTGLEGATARQFLRAGSVLDRRDLNGATFVAGTPVVGVHELTFPVSRDRAPARLGRGDRVTVLAFDDREDILRTALEDALVLTYDSESTGIGSSGEARLTLALPDAESVLEGTFWSYRSVTVVLTSRALDDEYLPRYPAVDPR